VLSLDLRQRGGERLVAVETCHVMHPLVGRVGRGDATGEVGQFSDRDFGCGRLCVRSQ
jgi:hypothetical protein